MLTIPQQFEELLKHPENILIMLKKNPLIADTAAALALKKVLENREKNSGNRIRKFSRRLQDEISPGPIRDQRQFIPS